MSEPCTFCGKPTPSVRHIQGQYRRCCKECFDKKYSESILQRGEEVKKSTDLKSWDAQDYTELFWQHLGIYVKNPNAHSWAIIDSCLRWAKHDSHAAAKSFEYGLKWAGLDRYVEEERW